MPEKLFADEIYELCKKNGGKMEQPDIIMHFGEKRGEITMSLVKQIRFNIRLLKKRGRVKTYGKRGTCIGGYQNPLIIEVIK